MLAANARFYEAFERGDFDAMSDVWEHSDRVVCTHPGWPSRRGWAAVSASFYSLFHGGAATQFILTNAAVTVVGDAAWVAVDENLLGPQAGATIAAVNVFAHRVDGWKLVVHAGSVVSMPVTEGRSP